MQKPLHRKSCFKRLRATPGIVGSSLLLTLLLIVTGRATELPTPSLSPEQGLQKHVRYLASEELLGRGVDTPGIDLARDYIAEEFRKYGLLPRGDNGTYLQALNVVTGVSIKQPSSVVLGNGSPLSLNDDWVPLGLSESGTIDAEVVFVGYGITDQEYGYDDYAGVDVKGKIALVLRYEPAPKDEKSPFQKPPRYSNHSSLHTKARNARDHGAIGMILVDLHHAGEEEKEFVSLRRSLWRSEGGLIAVQVKRQMVERWLEQNGISLSGLKANIDREEKPASRQLPGFRASLKVTLEKTTKKTENVIGILPGSDPQLKAENIIVGAHYDHLGLGYHGTRDSSQEGKIHYGADDNASGTAVVLHLAERFSRRSERPARTLVFVAFTGEELGLYGSRHYVTHPPFPLASTRAMINLDMVGRLRNNQVTVFGIESAKEFDRFVHDSAKQLGLEVQASKGPGRSDHISFYNKKIPALHFFTGTHGDYHRSTDTWEKLNLEGMLKVSDLVLTTAERIASAKAPLNFVGLPSAPAPEEGRKGYGTYLGTVPDFGQTEHGVRLAGVQEDSPAAIAGLREGDVIIEFAEIKVQNLEDLVAALRSKKPGEEVEITVLRSGKPVTVKAVLRARG